jgi:hypothetical protein
MDFIVKEDRPLLVRGTSSVEEIKSKRDELKKEVFRQLKLFEQETGCIVTNIEFERLISRRSIPELVDITVNVEVSL